MLATIIIDSFAKAEAPEIADALDMICSPDETYGFASACIYSFWSIPKREILYIGLAGDVTVRFRQHTGLRACDPDCCKIRQIDDYFRVSPRLGFSIMVQSTSDQPLSGDERNELAALYDEAFAADVDDYFSGELNIAIAEGHLLDLHHKLGDRLPDWNKIHGSKQGRDRRPFSEHREKMRSISDLLRTGELPDEFDEEIAAEGPPFELLLNLTGEELSYLNAKSTLRQIASDNTVEGHEEFLHGVRLYMLLNGATMENAIQNLVRHEPYYQARAEEINSSGYLHRTPDLPGDTPSASP